ncbi:hypothetical protein [Streptomyces sp. Rer75]|uniref:hypothetical protein n=1 Tax=Streptomyces sp. Rer75 TaxID=2750011 RepID=UPI00211E86A1|nr:hypothetical protein [Streptomyces sp. Rer75]
MAPAVTPGAGIIVAPFARSLCRPAPGRHGVDVGLKGWETVYAGVITGEFGTRLLDRGRGPVVPTVAGQRLVSHARALLAAASAAVEDVTEAALAPSAGVRTLRVGIMGHCARTPQDILTSVAAGRGAGSGLAFAMTFMDKEMNTGYIREH